MAEVSDADGFRAPLTAEASQRAATGDGLRYFVASWPDAEAARAAAAGVWRARLMHEAGGVAVLRGDQLDAVPRLLTVAERLCSDEGIGWSRREGREADGEGDEGVPTFAELLQQQGESSTL